MMTTHRLTRPLAVALLLLGAAGSLPAQRLGDLVKRSATPADALTGTWTGTAREQVDGAGELSFPIELRFSGTPEALRLQVSGRGGFPVDNGQKMTFEITATYGGTLRNGAVQMRSERIETRIVETGEVFPSEPQVLEARLQNGELAGRAGSAADGWTNFVARPASGGSADGPRGEAAAGGFAGTWEGTGREPGPDGRELSYPVRMQLDASEGGLRAELSADLRYPTDGGSVPVEYRASFRGQQHDGVLQLESESVRIRIVQQNRTQEGPAQTATGRIQNGVLRLEIGGEGQGSSRLELRRVGGLPERRGASNPLGDAPAPGVTDVEPRDVPPSHGGAGDARPAPYPTLILEPTKILDAGLGNVHSHTLMVPKGWQFGGGVLWTPHPDNFVHFVGTLRGPRQEELSFAKSETLRFESVNGQPAAGDQGQEGAGGSIVRRPPQTHGEVAIDVLMPRLRPGATDVRLVEAARLPDVEQYLREVYGETLQLLEQSLQQLRNDSAAGVGGMRNDAQMFLVAERARVRYREGGQEWEEEFRSTQLGTNFFMQSEFMTSHTSAWGVYDVRTCRARAGELDASLPTLLSIAGTLQETPRWSNAIAQMRLQIAQARARGRQLAFDAARSNAASSAGNDVSDIIMKGWRDRQASADRMQKATIDSIHGTHDFRAADGSTFAVTNQFDRAFVNDSGAMVLTNDTSFQPGADPHFNSANWQEMRRVDPFGHR